MGKFYQDIVKLIREPLLILNTDLMVQYANHEQVEKRYMWRYLH